MTNGSLPRDKKNENDKIQSPRTKIRTTCNYTVNKPPVPVRKPLLFPNSGKNPSFYQYYNLEEDQDQDEHQDYFEYHSQMLLLSSLKRQLEDLKAKEVEEKSEEELERSLLNAEFDHISSNLAELRARVADLRTQYGQMSSGRNNFNQTHVKRRLRETNAKVVYIQTCLERYHLLKNF